MTGETPKILIHSSEPGPLLTRMQEVAPDATVEASDKYDGLDTLVASFRPDVVYSICFAGRAGFPREALLGEDGPEWISVGGSGVDHLTPWNPERVTVTNSAGVASAMMAEYTFGALLHFTLDIDGLAADRSARHWNGERLMSPLKGKTLLIVGLGNTGQAIAARARAFGLHVLGTRARPAPMENVDEVHAADALPDLWGRADFIAVCTPLLPSTRHLVDARAFGAMKPDALLVDVSRGGVVQPDALIDAMRNRVIAGAALDVFESEPLPTDSPLWELDNTIISPHCSAVFEGWKMASFELFLENLARWQAGETLVNIVDPERGY